MSQEPAFTPPKDRWLAVLAVSGMVICLGMRFFEFSRALDGSPRSWSYTFEWPLFGIFIFWIWRKLERQQHEFQDDEDHD